MSLLLEALKKAERAKEEAQRRARTEGGEEAAAAPLEPQRKPVLTRDKLPDLLESKWPEPAPAGARVRFGALPTHAAQVANALAPLGARFEWLPTLGLGFASPTTVEPAALQGARRELATLGGWLAADGDWGPAPGSLRLQRSVKQRLDPAGVLAPGRFLA